jgi:polyisoprenoid-binding protein YceI
MPAAVLALLLAAGSSGSAEGKAWAVEPSRSTVRYHVVHRLHRVTATSASIEGKAVLKQDGRVLAMVRIPVASFDSGDRNRDANMREAVDTARHPFVVFRGVAAIEADLLAGARTVKTVMEGEVELHGTRERIAVPLTIELAPDGSRRARGTFEVSLDAFGIERPSLLFMKIEDACRIEVDLALREEKT